MVDAPARSAKVGLEPESSTLLVGHLFDARGEGLEKRDGAGKCLELDVILVTLFFALVKRFFKGVLLVGDETGLF